MSEQTPPSGRASSLPPSPSLEWLRKEAKRRLAELRRANADAQLADAQFDVAKQYGFSSWRALKSHVDSLSLDGQLVEAVKSGNVAATSSLLDEHPDGIRAKLGEYGKSPLHVAAEAGRVEIVDLLLARGADPNAREDGDNTYPMHWAAAGGRLDIVRRLADAGGDVVGRGDDHALEIIGWATCWEGAVDDAHRAVVDLLLARGAHHNIWSAIAMDSESAVRGVVARDSDALEARQSHNENFRRPLHFAVIKRRVDMVRLLLELGADPTGTDGSGYPPSVYATSPDIDRPILEAALARGGPTDLFMLVGVGDFAAAERLLREQPESVDAGGANAEALALMAKRNAVREVEWLLAHGVNPNARFPHWDAELTPLHLAAQQGHVEMIRVLLAAGADPAIRDSKHNGNVLEWAEFFGKIDAVRVLRAAMAREP